MKNQESECLWVLFHTIFQYLPFPLPLSLFQFRVRYVASIYERWTQPFPVSLPSFPPLNSPSHLSYRISFSFPCISFPPITQTTFSFLPTTWGDSAMSLSFFRWDAFEFKEWKVMWSQAYSSYTSSIFSNGACLSSDEKPLNLRSGKYCEVKGIPATPLVYSAMVSIFLQIRSLRI